MNGIKCTSQSSTLEEPINFPKKFTLKDKEEEEQSWTYKKMGMTLIPNPLKPLRSFSKTSHNTCKNLGKTHSIGFKQDAEVAYFTDRCGIVNCTLEPLVDEIDQQCRSYGKLGKTLKTLEKRSGPSKYN